MLRALNAAVGHDVPLLPSEVDITEEAAEQMEGDEEEEVVADE